MYVLASTEEQINSTQKMNNEMNLETLRIQNMPILKYTFDFNKTKENYNRIIMTNCDKKITGELYMSIHNVGMNTTRNIKIIIDSEIMETEQELYFEGQNILEKDNSVRIEYLISSLSKNKIKFIIKITYEDLINNVYEQEIEVFYEPMNIYTTSTRLINQNYEVKKERLL